jgi:hypothetical protein
LGNVSEELLATEKYHVEAFMKQHVAGPEHPGVLLRQQLEKVEGPFEPDYLDEMLYVAGETNLLGDHEVPYIDDAITVWRMVELARRGDPDVLKRIRM